MLNTEQYGGEKQVKSLQLHQLDVISSELQV